MRAHDLEPRLVGTEACFRPEAELEQLLRPFLTSDPVFGRLYHGHLDELWDEAAVAAARQRIAAAGAGLALVYGSGAARLIPDAPVIYVDVPKDAGQTLAGEGEVFPLGRRPRQPFNLTYKRLYFVDWPVLNREKRRLLPAMDVYVDASDINAPIAVAGDLLRRALAQMARGPFRVKPWFAPGPWGGQWMKETFGLSTDQPNYAWSFELIAPENGLLLGGDHADRAVECSFDLLLWQETDRVLGPRVAARYGSYFPVRFDYLDTMGGTNLSCQVHPRYDVHRLEFTQTIEDDMPAAFVVLNLVEGQICEVEAADLPPVELRFAETLIIPASVAHFRLRNRGSGRCTIVKAFVR